METGVKPATPPSWRAQGRPGCSKSARTHKGPWGKLGVHYEKPEGAPQRSSRLSVNGMTGEATQVKVRVKTPPNPPATSVASSRATCSVPFASVTS
ncbi:MAG: hypothetical protein CM15mP18_3500 [Methanobacteriota archaeon]|nr:MAG: hypothetical protein CM15mP18_3500 [Euryarchaeota archaeon]